MELYHSIANIGHSKEPLELLGKQIHSIWSIRIARIFSQRYAITKGTTMKRFRSLGWYFIASVLEESVLPGVFRFLMASLLISGYQFPPQIAQLRYF